VELLRRYGYDHAKYRAFIQSFEVASLRKLAGMTKLPLVQLISDSGAPWDFVANSDPRTYADLVEPAGLDEISRYAAAVGPHKNLIVPRVHDALGTPTALVRDAHHAGLIVHAWTFRAENTFLPKAFRSSADPNAFGELEAEVKHFLDLDVDGFFTDHANIVAAARDAPVRR